MKFALKLENLPFFYIHYPNFKYKILQLSFSEIKVLREIEILNTVVLNNVVCSLFYVNNNNVIYFIWKINTKNITTQQKLLHHCKKYLGSKILSMLLKKEKPIFCNIITISTFYVYVKSQLYILTRYKCNCYWLMTVQQTTLLLSHMVLRFCNVMNHFEESIFWQSIFLGKI